MQKFQCRGVSLRLLSTFMIVALLTSCAVDGADVEYWKRTVKGPTKLQIVIGSDRYSNELRTKAALAFVEMDRMDIPPLHLLRKSLIELAQHSPAKIAAIVDAMIPRIAELVSADKSKVSKQQIRAKDAAFIVIPYTSEQARPTLVDAVVDWYAYDFPGRSLIGDYSAEQVLQVFGPSAATRFVRAMNAKMPQAALVQIAEIIAKSGARDAYAAGAKRLVQIESEIRSPEFERWLKSEFERQLAASGQSLAPERMQEAIDVNREKFIVEGVFPAMKSLGSEPVVRQRLLKIASAKPAPGLSDVSRNRHNVRRARALQALEGHVKERELQELLAIALDSSNSIVVRDYAFDRVGDIRSRAAISSLWPLVQSTSNQKLSKRLRWRAGELILAIGGRGIVNQFFGKLSTASSVKYEPEELEGYATRMSQMTPPPTRVIREKLRSRTWWARVIAMKFLERRGTSEDIKRLEQFVSDPAKLVGDGWSKIEPPQKSVGAVAKRAAMVLGERLSDVEK